MLPRISKKLRVAIASYGFFSVANVVTAENVNQASVPVPYDGVGKAEIVEINGSKNFNIRKESTVAKVIVTREDISRYGDSSIAEVLRHVPGITISGVPGRGGEIQMRGLGNGYTQILIDGEPSAPGFTLDSLSPNLIESIEVSRVATVDMSAQAIAGTINIILKKKIREGQREIKAAFANYNGNSSYFFDGQSSDRFDAFSYTLAGGIGRENNVWPYLITQHGFDADGKQNLLRLTNKKEFSRDDSFNLAPRLNWKLDSGDVINAELMLRGRLSDAGTIDLRTVIDGVPPLYAANDLKLKIDTLVLNSKVNWNRDFSNGAQLQAKLGGNYSRRNSDAKFLGYDEVHRNVLDEGTSSLARDKSLTFSAKYRAPSFENHAFVMGIDSELSQRSENRIQRQTAPVGYPASNLDELYDAQITRLALYSQDEWDVTQRLSLYYGLRWEGLETGSRGNVMIDVKNRSSVFSPVIQAVWKLPESKSDQVRLGLSRTYKAPNTRDLMPRRYVANDNTSTTPDMKGNPDLRPELAWGFDLAYERFFGDIGMFSASVNARHIQNVILRRIDQVNGSWISSPFNNGTANTRGIELETKINLRKSQASMPDIDLRANIAKNWSSVDAVPGPNNRLEKQRPVSANLGMDFRPGTIPMTIGTSFAYQSGASVRLSEHQSARLSPRRVLDFYGTWKLDRKTQIRALFSNVFKQDNFEDADYFDANGLMHQVTKTPTNRIFRLTYEMKL